MSSEEGCSDPDCGFDGIGSLREDIQGFIDSGDWMVIGVPLEDNYAMFYTIGLTSLNMPELILFGPFEKDRGAAIINDFAKKLILEKDDAVKLELNKRKYDFLGDKDIPVVFINADNDKAKQEYAIQATEFYGSEDAYSLVQVVWPDYYCKFPWEDDCELGCIESQPIIGKYLSPSFLAK